MNSHRLKIDSLSPGVRNPFSRLPALLPIPFFMSERHPAFGTGNGATNR
jgi:hypothetical protein